MSLLQTIIKTIFIGTILVVPVLFLMGMSPAEDVTQNEESYNKLVSASKDVGGDGTWVVLEALNDVEFRTVSQVNWQPVSEGTLLKPGSKIRAKSDSRAFLSHGKDKALLAANSQLDISQTEKSDWVSIVLKKGLSLFDVNRRSINRFQVKTKFIVATIKGTTFSVSAADDESVVTVTKGVVGTKEMMAVEALT